MSQVEPRHMLQFLTAKVRILTFFSTLISLGFSQAPTVASIQSCESNTAQMYAYNQCIAWATNCSFIEGTVTSGVCSKPTATNAACIQPGFLLNTSGNCVDCRTEVQCLTQCNGFWDPNLLICMRSKYKSFKTSSTSGTLCTSYTTASDCNKCRDQQFALNTSTSTCMKCPPNQWNSSTMTCSLFSSCSPSTGEGLSTDLSKCTVCYGESSQKYLSQFSHSCELCPTECAQCGGYTNCSSCSSNFTFSADTVNLPGVCECKGAFSLSGTACNACPSNCSSCQGNGTCIICAANYGLNSAGVCVLCSVFNAQNIYNCDIPQLSFCQTVSSDGLYCLQCSSSNQVYDTVLKYCVCANGMIQNITTGACSSCSSLYPNCSTCNSTTCLTCTDPNFTLNSGSQGCTCSGYIKNSQCYQCSLTLSNCSACNSSGSSCTACFSSYGLLASSSTCYACSTIDPNCLACNGQSQCTSCNNGYVLNSASTACVCDSSKNLYNLLNGICYNCSNAISSCNTCTANSSKNGLTCTSCVTPYVIVNGQCSLCATGYYQSGNSCLQCTETNCASCTSTTCFQCQSGYTLNNNTCTCVSPMIVDTDGTCKSCSSKFGTLCQTCSTSTCSTCGGTNYTANSTGCACINGVNNASAQKCISCPSNCVTCTSDASFTTLTCSLCGSGFKLLANGTCGTCASNQYYTSSTQACSNCNTNCSGCADNQSGGQCTGCTNGFLLSSQLTCVCNTTKVLASDNVTCVNCSTKFDSNCATCSQSACLTCTSNYNLNGSGTCIQCSSGQYFSSTTLSCQSCSSNCSQCTNITGACTQCINNYDINSTSGLCQCTATKVLNSQNNCILCSNAISNCSQCSSTTACTVCTSGYNLMSNNSCAQCGSAQYYSSSNQTCQNCPTNCTACSNNTAACTGNCLNNYRLDSTAGACVCSLDRILVSNSCQLCSTVYANCSQCSNTACTVCTAPYTLSSNGSCQPCANDEIYVISTNSCAKCSNFIPNCQSCSSQTKCTACFAAPFTLSSDGSTCLCPTGNYLTNNTQAGTNNQCIPCTSFDSNCLQCTAKNNCTWCQKSYFYDSTQKICRVCNSNEYYNYSVSGNVQQCVNCNVIHPMCSACSNATTCTSCSGNYDLNQSNTCQCSSTKILVPDPNNSNATICQLCSQVVDPHCSQCSQSNQCSQCMQQYSWVQTQARCLPNIQLTVTNTNSKSQQTNNKALVDMFQLSITIPQSFWSNALSITILYYDSVTKYNAEVQNLQSNNVPSEKIPFTLQNCTIFTQDDLSILPHPKYTKITQSDGSSALQRLDSFLLHDGAVRFVYLVSSLNGSFQRYSGIIDVTLTRVYTNMRDLSFALNQQIRYLTSFSLYNVFFQIYTQNTEICNADAQCGHGTCSIQDSMCLCSSGFLLFDCSDFISFNYDQIISVIDNSIVVSNPKSYSDIFVAQTLPLLTTSTSESSKAGVFANINAIQQIIQNEILDNSQQAILFNLMDNVMNSVSSNIKTLDPDFNATDIMKVIQNLEDITQTLLVNFDNMVSFTTNEMQLLAQINRDPTRIVTYASTKTIFDVSFDNSAALFEPTLYESVGLEIQILRYSFKTNPHKLTNNIFKDQPRIYPLIIYFTSKQPSTIGSRILQSNAPLNPVAMNMTFSFEVYNPIQLKNLICLTLTNLTSDQYELCSNIQILQNSVICTCENSATLFEDLSYQFLPKPPSVSHSNDSAPVSMVITIIILSILLAILLVIQLRGRRGNKRSTKLDEAYAKSRATAAAARKRQLETEQNNMLNTELKDLRKSSMQESINPMTRNMSKSGNYETIFNQQQTLNSNVRNQNVLIEPDQQSSPVKDYLYQAKLNFYGNDKEDQDFENSPKLPPRLIDPSSNTPGMEQQFDDNQVQNREQRASVLKFEDDEESQSQK